MSGRGLALLIVLAFFAALIVFPSSCSYTSVTAPKNCVDTVVERHHAHHFHHSDTLYVGTCGGIE